METIGDVLAVVDCMIGGKVMKAVDARKIHAWLEVEISFEDWIESRINERALGFREDVEFSSTWTTNTLGHRSKEYWLSLDMAHELCLIEPGAKGTLARDYFIRREAELRAKYGLPDPFLEWLSNAGVLQP
jgi:anti-repressor protein